MYVCVFSFSFSFPNQIQMEALYSKLYDKYTKLKATKASEIEQLSLDQEEKFKTYVSAADELIGYLTSEKDKLYAHISDLRQEIASIRSAKDEELQKYEKMLIEENQKNKELSEEIERLQRKEFDSSDKQLSRSPLPFSNSTKRKRLTMHVNEVDNDNIFSGVFYNDATQPKCCRPRLGGTVNAASDASSNCCLFQELVECLVDLKFSIETPSDDNIQITAVHESSGYSFSLGWVKKNGGPEEEETMMMYHVSSLGTFERVAPEWMRDMMLFSKSMSSVFFKRLSAYIQSS